MKRVTILSALLALLGTMSANAAPANFVYTSAGELATAAAILERPDIEGAQVVYSWKLLEPSEGVYDFSPIEEDLARTDALGKKLFIQVQDRFFSPEARNIPAYLLDDPKYGGGLVQQIEEGKTEGYGWTTMQWRPEVRARYQALLAALAARMPRVSPAMAISVRNWRTWPPRGQPSSTRWWCNMSTSGPANGRTTTPI